MLAEDVTVKDGRVRTKDSIMECPHCKSTFQKDHVRTRMKKWGKDKQSFYSTKHCPNCDKRILLRDDNPDIESINTRLSKLRTYCNYCKMNGQFDEYRDAMSEILELQKQIEDMRNGEMSTKVKDDVSEERLNLITSWGKYDFYYDKEINKVVAWNTYTGNYDLSVPATAKGFNKNLHLGTVENMKRKLSKDSKTKDVYSEVYKGFGLMIDDLGVIIIMGAIPIAKVKTVEEAKEKIDKIISERKINDSKKLMKDAASVALKKLGQVKRQVKDRKTKDSFGNYKGYKYQNDGGIMILYNSNGQIVYKAKASLDDILNERAIKNLIDHITEKDSVYESLIKSKTIRNVDSKTKDQDDLKEKLIAFFKANPNPDDDKVHTFAEQNGINPHELEEEIYKLVTEHVGMVKDKKTKDAEVVYKNSKGYYVEKGMSGFWIVKNPKGQSVQSCESKSFAIKVANTFAEEGEGHISGGGFDSKKTKDASQAYIAGYTAARGAYHKGTNPIKNDPVKAKEWDEGWEDGNKDKMELSAKGSGQEYVKYGSHFKDKKTKDADEDYVLVSPETGGWDISVFINGQKVKTTWKYDKTLALQASKQFSEFYRDKNGQPLNRVVNDKKPTAKDKDNKTKDEIIKLENSYSAIWDPTFKSLEVYNNTKDILIKRISSNVTSREDAIQKAQRIIDKYKANEPALTREQKLNRYGLYTSKDKKTKDVIPSPKDTYNKIRNFDKIALQGFARRIGYPELSDLKKMDTSSIIAELISFLHGEKGDQFLENPNNFKDSKPTAKDKLLKGLDSLKRRVKDAFGMNTEEQQKEFDTRNIEEETIKNNAFRRVVFTGNTLQLVLMSLLPNEDIGMEVHDNVDQFFRIEEGEGLLEIEGQGSQPVKDGFSILITAGTKHNVKNIGSEPLKLYTIYGPPNHPADRLQNTKAEAVKEEEESKKVIGDRKTKDADYYAIVNKKTGQVLSTANSEAEAKDELNGITVSNRNEYIIKKTNTPPKEWSMKDSKKTKDINLPSESERIKNDFESGRRDHNSGYYDKWYRWNRKDNGRAYDDGFNSVAGKPVQIIEAMHDSKKTKDASPADKIKDLLQNGYSLKEAILETEKSIGRQLNAFEAAEAVTIAKKMKGK